MGNILPCVGKTLDLTVEIYDIVKDFNSDEVEDKISYLIDPKNYKKFSKTDRQKIKELVRRYFENKKQHHEVFIKPPLLRQTNNPDLVDDNSGDFPDMNLPTENENSQE